MKPSRVSPSWRWPGVGARFLAGWTAILGLILPVLRVTGAGGGSFDEEMETYHRTAASGRVARLQTRLDQDAARLTHDDKRGYLPAVLAELGVSPSSQVLVFSKTSPHKTLITPQNPRALYFNENAAVAFVPGAPALEIAVSDPELGTVFYTLDQKPAGRPRFERDDRCLECHASSKSLGVPGWLARSFPTSQDGEVSVLGGTPMVTHRTPIAERWGGYYVTGEHGPLTHLGNHFAREATPASPRKSTPKSGIVDLGNLLDTRAYPAPGSDIVALLVLDHQAHLQNLLTKLNQEARSSLRDHGDLSGARAAGDAVLKYLLFTEEAPLPAPVRGSPGFRGDFVRRGPRDKRGRSLHEFELHTRLFKYPCSPMIYSEAFAALPGEARKHLYHQLWQVLAGEDGSFRQAALTAANRQAIREILAETKSDLPAYWQL